MRYGGIGTIWAIPSISTSSTPIPLAIAKSVDLTFKQDRKPLYGQWMDPIDVLAAQRVISIKLAHNDFRAATAKMVMQGGSLTANSTKLTAVGEAATIPGTPYQVTVAQAATWSEDGGVLDLTAGIWLTRVTSSPSSGQYSVAAGVYTFAAADTTHKLVITYSYTATTTGSQTLVVANQPVAQSTGYLVRLYQQFNVAGTVRAIGYEFPSVHFSELNLAMKADDWNEESLTGMVAQDSATTTTVSGYFGE